MTERSGVPELESDESLPLKLLQALFVTCALFLLAFTGIFSLTWPQQAVLGLLTVLLGIWMDRSSSIAGRDAMRPCWRRIPVRPC